MHAASKAYPRPSIQMFITLEKVLQMFEATLEALSHVCEPGIYMAQIIWGCWNPLNSVGRNESMGIQLSAHIDLQGNQFESASTCVVGILKQN